MKILLDSNIIIYSLNKLSPKCMQAQGFIVEHQSNLVVAHQDMNETLRILTHKTFPSSMTSGQALKAVDGILQGLEIINPPPVTYNIVKELISLYKLKGNAVFDAYLVATMLSNDINHVATDNVKHFKLFKQIKVVNPFD